MALKKAAKKVAKKAPGRPDPHRSANDARRTFEHLGRVQVLSALASSQNETLSVLTTTADMAFRARKYKDSADLLRAAEHLTFASLQHDATETIATDLGSAIEEELQHLEVRAEEHRSRHTAPKEIEQIATQFLRESRSALRRGSYRSALEYARGAEALAHVHDLGANSLPAPASQGRLRD